VQIRAARARLITRPQRGPVRERPDQVRTEPSSLHNISTTGTSSPGMRIATTIVFLEVSIHRWIAPAGDVTLDMAASFLPPLWPRCSVIAPS
jgi:hypothetical protein